MTGSHDVSTPLVNADFDQRVALLPPTPADWVPSPTAGVLRRPLDRVGGEIARATSLVRYLPGSQFKRHTHGGGEEILVLEGVFSDETGDQPVRIDTRSTPWRPGLVPGLSVMPLHEFDGVSTALVRWAPDTQFNPHSHPGGEEIFVLEGLFRDEHGAYPAGSWLRGPRWSRHTPYAAAEGALIYVKVGHLGAELLDLPLG